MGPPSVSSEIWVGVAIVVVLLACAYLAGACGLFRHEGFVSKQAAILTKEASDYFNTHNGTDANFADFNRKVTGGDASAYSVTKLLKDTGGLNSTNVQKTLF